MVQFLYHLQVLVFFTIGSGKILNRTLYGPRMCEQMCSYLGECRYPLFEKISLTCYFSSGRGLPTPKQAGIYRLDTMKEKVNMTEGRIISSHKGLLIIVSLEVKPLDDVHMTAKEKKAHLPRLSLMPEKIFDTNIPADLRNKHCTLLSMTVSYKRPDLVYLLLSCPGVPSCYRVLSLLDLNSERLLPKTLDMCENDEGWRQIFTGPCVQDPHYSCLYNVNNGERIRLTIYIEPAPNTYRVQKVFGSIVRHNADTFLCSVLASEGLLCLSNGNQLLFVHMIKGIRLAKMKKICSRFESFPGIKDFKIDTSSIQIKAVLVQEDSLALITLDFDKCVIQKISSAKIKVHTVTVISGTVLLHSRLLEEPFYVCKIGKLQLCGELQP